MKKKKQDEKEQRHELLAAGPDAHASAFEAEPFAEPLEGVPEEPLAGNLSLEDPMDELFAELLAQEGEQLAEPAVEPGTELTAPTDDEILARMIAAEEASQPALESDDLASLEVASAPEQPLWMTEEVDPTVPPAPAPEFTTPEESAEETRGESEAMAVSADEMLAELLAEAEHDATPADAGAPEPDPAPVEAIAAVPTQPVPPQPPLDDVIGRIDKALRKAPPVAAAAEGAGPVHHKVFSQLDDYVVFSLSGSDYAVPVKDVAEIGRVPVITRVPNVPEFVRGITNLRGEVVPVLNLPHLLGLQDAPLSARGRVLFLQSRQPISGTGLLVDEVKGIQRIQSQQLEQVTGLIDDKVTSVLRGVHGRGDRLLNILDLEQLFQLQELRELETR